MPALVEPLRLPSGLTLSNRIAKAAMTENLADADNQPTERHERLYRRWAEGGSGLRGLADRVEALAGRLRVSTPHGGGTRVRAELPCE